MFSTRHGAGGHHPCMRCAIRLEGMVQGSESPNRLLSATTKTGRKVQSLKENDEMVTETDQSGEGAQGAEEDIKRSVRAFCNGVAFVLGGHVGRDWSGSGGIVFSIHF